MAPAMDPQTPGEAAPIDRRAGLLRSQGELMGIPATGKSIDAQLIDVIRFGDDGLAHDHWGDIDSLAMMQQFGVVPVGPPPLPLRTKRSASQAPSRRSGWSRDGWSR